uniref:SFRICE_019384 n=1 Tax=Spodoptera frugiperda TaxID=7108 RepID=A0A2H1VIN9_SPOFR
MKSPLLFSKPRRKLFACSSSVGNEWKWWAACVCGHSTVRFHLAAKGRCSRNKCFIISYKRKR